MKYLLPFLAFAAALPGAAEAQRDVTRRAYTFLENRLVVAVHAQAPGELQVVRGQRGRIEVAARARDGFAGFGLGGDITRQLRLTAVGSDAVQYLVVVPENVSVRVQLPDGGWSSVSTRQGIATYRWGADRAAQLDWERADRDAILTEMVPTTPGGLFVVHTGNRVPASIDVPDLASIRSISLRVQGEHFTIATSRPLAVEPGTADRFEVRVTGEPLDVVVYIPRSTSRVQLRSGGQRLAQVVRGRPESFCGGVVLQSPTDHQDWLTLFPEEGRLRCR